MMNNIPTAKEFIIQNKDRFAGLSVDVWLIEFAQLHREAILKAAAEKAEIAYKRSGYFEQGYLPEINKESILNAYPKENIK